MLIIYKGKLFLFLEELEFRKKIQTIDLYLKLTKIN